MLLLIAGGYKPSNAELDRIKALDYEVYYMANDDGFIPVNPSFVNAIICNNLFIHHDISQFANLKFIQLTSAGLDRVPLDYIKKHHIKLCSAQGVYSIPIAEWVVLKILEIYKKSQGFYQNQTQRKWEKQRDLLELSDKTAVIIGIGSIGTEVAKRLKVFGVSIIGVDIEAKHNPYFDKSFFPSDLKSALQDSDIVILTLPLTQDTKYLINSQTIAEMKDDCVLINVSRGQIIEESALISALDQDKFLGVALDVFENEPLPPESPLWDFDKVVITPHNAFISDKISDRLFKLIEKNLIDFIQSCKKD